MNDQSINPIQLLSPYIPKDPRLANQYITAVINKSRNVFYTLGFITSNMYEISKFSVNSLNELENFHH